MIRVLAPVLAALLVSTSAGAFWHGSSGLSGITTFAHLNVGGGGFTSGIDIAPDGTAVARVDVYGTYKYNSVTGQWDLLETTNKMPTAANPGGGIEIRVAASNTQIIYKWMGDGKLYRSNDGGTSFVQLTGFGTHDAGSNNGSSGIFSGSGRLDGYKMAIDPINPDVLYVGTSAGVLVSSNASQGSGVTPTFASVSGITAANSNGSGYLFAFDPSGGSTGGKSNVLYVSSEGQGIFKMTTPSGTFSAVSGAPTVHINNMAVSPNGVVWVAANSAANAYKLVSGTWTTYAQAVTGIRPKAVAIDPNHSASNTTEHVILIEDGGNLSTSTNSGTSWTGKLSFTRTAVDVPWLANTNEFYMSTSLIAYNKATDVLWLAEGIGTWTAPGATNANYVWTSNTKGIESLVTLNAVSPSVSTAQPALSAWDRPFFGIASIGTFPSDNGPTYATSIIGGWGLDWAGSTLAGLATWVAEYSATSVDGGLTWTAMTGSGQSRQYATNSPTASGSVLHFASFPANYVHTGMSASNITNSGSLPNGVLVLSVSGGDVTLTANVSSTVASGDTIKFTDALLGGAIAASSSTNFVVTTSNNSSFPYYTTNGGATWTPISISGVPRQVSGSTNGTTSVTVVDSSNFVTGSNAVVQDTAGCVPGNSYVASIPDSTHIVLNNAATCTAAIDVIKPFTGWSWAYYLNIKNVAADRVTASKFYLYNHITGRVYASTDSGATWTAVNTTPTNIVTTYSFTGGQNSFMKSVPGNAGHLFMSGANIQYQSPALIRSTDGGITWTAVSNVCCVNAIGFGKSKPGGGGYPAVFIYGQVSGVQSLWRSDDNCTTWVNLGANPVGSLDLPIIDLDGDKNIYGQVYGAFGSSGWFYGVLH